MNEMSTATVEFVGLRAGGQRWFDVVCEACGDIHRIDWLNVSAIQPGTTLVVRAPDWCFGFADHLDVEKRQLERTGA